MEEDDDGNHLPDQLSMEKVNHSVMGRNSGDLNQVPQTVRLIKDSVPQNVPQTHANQALHARYALHAR
jgi:hypothetical protein